MKTWQWKLQIIQRTDLASDCNRSQLQSHFKVNKKWLVIAAVEKDVKVFIEELKEISVVMYLSLNSL